MIAARWLALLGSLLLLACPAPPEPAVAPAQTPSPAGSDAPEIRRCPVRGTVQHHEHGPLEGVLVSGSASEAVTESHLREVDSHGARTDENGRFDLRLKCGAVVRLEFEGWIWASHPAELIAEARPAPLEITLLPERTVRLWVAGDPGEPVQNARFLPADGGPAVPVPFEGLHLEGIPYGRVAGTIEVDGRPARTWRLSRSDTLDEIGPMVFEATVHMGDGAPLWIELAAREVREVVGAWCVQEGVRGQRCKLRDGGFHCPCVEQRVAVATERWDVGVVRDVSGGDVEFEALPEAVEQCLAVAGAERVRVHPAGVDDVALLGKRGPGERFCLRLPRGEAVTVVPEGEVAASIAHVAEQPGDVVLR